MAELQKRISVQNSTSSPLLAPTRKEGERSAPRRQYLKLAMLAGVHVIIIGGTLLLWIAAAAHRWLTPLLLPRPESVVTAAYDGYHRGVWLDYTLSTLYATLKAFGIALVGGLALGALFSFKPITKKIFYPYVYLFQTFPKIAVAPLLIVWLGYGSTTKVTIGASLALFPVLIASMSGLSDVDRNEWELMRSVGANRWQEFRHLRVPHAMSYIFPSLDIAVVAALLGVVTGELIGSNSGLGNLLVNAEGLGDSASIYALLGVLAVMGVSLLAVVKLVGIALPASIVPNLAARER